MLHTSMVITEVETKAHCFSGGMKSQGLCVVTYNSVSGHV